MMDWEEERIRQERRERRRRLHEKLAENARTDVARRQDEDQDQAKLEKKQAASNINKEKSIKQKSVKKKAKQKAKWRLPKFNIKGKGKGKANSKKQKQGQAGKRKQQVTSNQGMPPVKKVQKSDPTNWKKMVLLLLPFVIALFVAGYYASPLNHVASITLEGVEDTESMNLSPLNEGMSVTDLKNSKGEVEQAIVNQNPSVKSATVNVSDWNKVAVNVSAYRQLGYIQIADFFYPLLENNEIIDTPLPSLEKELPLFEGYDIANEDQKAKLTETVKALSSLSDDIIQKISLVTYTGDESNTDRIALQMVDGNVVRGFISSIGDRMSYYNGIASQLDGQTGLIDMEVAIYFTELNDGNNPYALEEDKKAYDESVAAESSAASESEASELDVLSSDSASESTDSSSTESTSASDASSGSSSETSQVESTDAQAASSSVETDAASGNSVVESGSE
ncbi:cell division protein FtsQ [Aerococcus urinaeequi]|uniref:cell division protein FtsQ/DivIB n=1 Tax=Aerococcus urinaeequi TaxID=51665 RepID=UPI00228008F3|nr:cell division protein FtsQ/DivIB [Aerococcus urinaeequi]MCY7730431.1 cell division protein FtsQ [Aerococcus urinaeequi]